MPKNASKRMMRNGGNEDTYRTTQLNYEIIDNSSFRYYYDNVGNITQIKTGKRVIDEANSNPSNIRQGTVLCPVLKSLKNL